MQIYLGVVCMRTIVGTLLGWVVFFIGSAGRAAEPADTGPTAPAATEKPSGPDAAGLIRLAKDHDLWIDPKRKVVIVDGYVCLREGQLEMFACLKGTKEHESVVAVDCKAQFIHAGLLAVGAKPGTPVQWDPYRPATGTVIDVLVLWKDPDGTKRQVRAQEWVKDLKAGKPMTHAWVFAGSSFWTDPDTKQRLYAADGGDFMCVSNFSSAMLDLPVESSQGNAELLFVANTDAIPPLKTKVRLVLKPRLDQKTETSATPAEQPAAQPDKKPDNTPPSS